MSVERILSVLEKRGLSVRYDPPDKLSLQGPPEEITPELRDALKDWRAEILERFASQHAVDLVSPNFTRPMELKWNGTGLVGRRLADGTKWDDGAGWWRYAGETEWRPIPDRGQARGEAP